MFLERIVLAVTSNYDGLQRDSGAESRQPDLFADVLATSGMLKKALQMRAAFRYSGRTDTDRRSAVEAWLKCEAEVEGAQALYDQAVERWQGRLTQN